MSALSVCTHADNFGACIHGVDLSTDLQAPLIEEIRNLWLQHQVVYFPKQNLQHRDLERVTRYFGDFGCDPYVQPLHRHKHILEIRREPGESVSPFGSSWHSDWSFQTSPPSATLLHAKVIPPFGGDTLFADGYRAFEALDATLANELQEMRAIHSARRPYSPEGFANSGGHKRSMAIVPDADAWSTQTHPIVRTHPETGRRALWVNPVYTVGIENLSAKQADALLKKLFDHALSNAFIYRHQWQANMLVLWDNRCTQHCAQGGYDGHLRVLHRTTVAGDQPY